MIKLISETALDKVSTNLYIFCDRQLITGVFGIVYKAVLNGWRCGEVEQVAVKTLKGNRQCAYITIYELRLLYRSLQLQRSEKFS